MPTTRGKTSKPVAAAGSSLAKTRNGGTKLNENSDCKVSKQNIGPRSPGRKLRGVINQKSNDVSNKTRSSMPSKTDMLRTSKRRKQTNLLSKGTIQHDTEEQKCMQNDKKNAAKANKRSNKDPDEYVIEKVVDNRHRKKRVEYLIKWEGYSYNENTWEPAENIEPKSLITEYEKSKKSESKAPARKNLDEKVTQANPEEALRSGSSDDIEEYIVETIVDKKSKGRKIEYLVKWLGWDDKDNTWEPMKNLPCKDLIKEFEERVKKDGVKESTSKCNKRRGNLLVDQVMDADEATSSSHDNHSRASRRSNRKNENTSNLMRNESKKRPGPKRKTTANGDLHTNKDNGEDHEAIKKIRLAECKDQAKDGNNEKDQDKQSGDIQEPSTEEDFNALFNDASKEKTVPEDSIVIEHERIAEKQDSVEIINLEESLTNETINLDETDDRTKDSRGNVTFNGSSYSTLDQLIDKYQD